MVEVVGDDKFVVLGCFYCNWSCGVVLEGFVFGFEGLRFDKGDVFRFVFGRGRGFFGFFVGGLRLLVFGEVLEFLFGEVVVFCGCVGIWRVDRDGGDGV